MLFLSLAVFLAGPDGGSQVERLSHSSGHGVAAVGQKNLPADDREAAVMKRFACVCGACPRTPVDECECKYAAEMRGEIKRLLAARADVRAALVAEYGETVLVENKPARPAILTWFPIVLVFISAGLIVLSVRRSRATH